MKHLNRREWMFLVFIFIFSFIPTFGGMFRIAEILSGTAFIPPNPRAIAEPFPIVLHIVGSSVFCLFGAMQFIPSIRRAHPDTHRKMGKIIALAGLLSALTGLWMTLFFTFPSELQGNLLYWARSIFSIMMISLIIKAITSIRTGDIEAHRSAMLWAYAIGQGASTQAFLGIGWMAVSGLELMGSARDMLMVSGWVINLLVAKCLVTKPTWPRQKIT